MKFKIGDKIEHRFEGMPAKVKVLDIKEDEETYVLVSEQDNVFELGMYYVNYCFKLKEDSKIRKSHHLTKIFR